MAVAAARWECPFCGEPTDELYRCTNCGKDLTNRTLSRWSA